MRSDIDPKELDLPEEPTVCDIRVDRSDAPDEDSMRVWVIVTDETPERLLQWPKTRPIENEIKHFFQENMAGKFPVISFRKKSEFEEETRAGK